MNYLETAEYLSYGLETTTDSSWVTAASTIIDAHCRRATLGVNQYEERLKMTPESNSVRLSYLPLAIVAPATTPVVSLQGRYGVPRRGEWPFADCSLEFALVFGLPGSWTAIDPGTVDIWEETGEITFAANVLGLAFNEVAVVYTAGLATIPPSVKVACAQIVKNAQVTPALNVKSGKIDQMRLDYFGESLVDETVRNLLQPFVAQKVGS
jgi:hypothetical protein